MSEPTRRGNTVGAVTLIVLGMVLLADRLDWFAFSWPMILIGIGVALLIQSIVDKRHQPVQGGVLLLLLGLVFLADVEHWLPWGLARDWPMILLAIGVAVIIGYFVNPHRHGNLTGGIILLVLGGLFYAAEYHYVRWGTLHEVFEWWPILLLALGVWLLVKRPTRPRE